MSTTSSSATSTLYVNGRPAQDELARLRTELEAAFHFKRQFQGHLDDAIAIGTALSLGFSPIPVAVGIALASSLGFMMPVSTPPNAIVYASGYVPITKMIKSGAIIDIIGVFCITIPIVLLLVKAVMGV